MGRVILGRNFGKDIADALGLRSTRRIKIDIPYDDIVTVEVEYLLEDEDSERFTGYMQRKKYELVVIEEDEPREVPRENGVFETTVHGPDNRTYQAVAE